MPRFFDRPHIDPLILDFFNFAPKRCCLFFLLTVLLCEFCQPRLFLLHLELRHRQVFLGAAALASLHIVIPCLSHGGEEIILQNGIGFRSTVFPFAFSSGFPCSSSAGLESHFAHADLLYRFLDRTHQRFILAAVSTIGFAFHDGNVDHMKVIVVHVLPQRVGHGAVALVACITAERIYCSPPTISIADLYASV